MPAEDSAVGFHIFMLSPEYIFMYACNNKDPTL